MVCILMVIHLQEKFSFSDNDYRVDSKFTELKEETFGEALLKAHTSYTQIVHKILEAKIDIHGMSHITGGGFYENLVRVLPENLDIHISKNSWEVLNIFKLIQKIGSIEEQEMHRVFNMGIGLCMILKEKDAEQVLKMIREESEHKAYLIGKVKTGSKKVEIN